MKTKKRTIKPLGTIERERPAFRMRPSTFELDAILARWTAIRELARHDDLDSVSAALQLLKYSDSSHNDALGILSELHAHIRNHPDFDAMLGRIREPKP